MHVGCVKNGHEASRHAQQTLRNTWRRLGSEGATNGALAKDIDFRKVLGWEIGKGVVKTTHEKHLASPFAMDGGEVYTIPYNTSVDGNTVEIGMEQAKFGKAAVEYQATLDFLQGRVNSFKRALKGE